MHRKQMLARRPVYRLHLCAHVEMACKSYANRISVVTPSISPAVQAPAVMATVATGRWKATAHSDSLWHTRIHSILVF